MKKRNIKIVVNLASCRENTCLLALSLKKRSNVENSDQQSEHKNESLHKKGNMKITTMLTSKKVTEGESEVVGVNNACRLMNEVLNAWLDAKMVEDVVNKKER